MVRKTYFIQIVISILVAISGGVLLAQDHTLDDEGNVNNPQTNPRANACYTGASLAGSCVTQVDWECGWAFIRFEYGIFPRQVITGPCVAHLPEITMVVSGPEQTTSPAPGVVNTDPNPGPVIEPTPTIPPVDNDRCYFIWARYPLLDLAQRVKGQIGQAGVKVDGVSAVAFGEDCISYATGENKGFSAMETDFDISVSLADLADEVDLDTQENAVRDVLRAIPGADLVGGRIGQVYITFVSPTGETRKIGP